MKRIRTGNYQYGTQCEASRITEEIAIAIHDSPESCRVLEAKYGISRTTINKIKRELTWRHLWPDKNPPKYVPPPRFVY